MHSLPETMHSDHAGCDIVAITGGTGFVGRRLVALHLKLGHRVRILSRQNAVATRSDANPTYIRGDLTDPSARLDAFIGEARVLYHLAGEIANAGTMHAVHVLGTERLLAAAAGRIRHWVHLSSAGVYGPVRSGVIDESFPIAPVGQYEITKAEGERLVAERAPRHGFSYTILRPSIVFGPDMGNDSLRKLVRMVGRGLFFHVGEGATAPYVAVEDVVEALFRCASHANATNQVYNLSANVSMDFFVGTIARALGRSPPKLRLPEIVAKGAAAIGEFIPGFPLTRGRLAALTRKAVYDSSKIARHLDIHPERNLPRYLEVFARSVFPGAAQGRHRDG